MRAFIHIQVGLFLMRYWIVLLLPFMLSGCFNVYTSTNYNVSMTSMSVKSSVIHLSVKDKTTPPFYFILESFNDDGFPKDVLKVRWVNHDKRSRLFDGMNSFLRFEVDRSHFIVLKPRSLPRRMGYDVNKNAVEEEAIFNITREQLKDLAYAKSVEVELNSKHKVYMGKFNRWHTFRAFKDFLKNT